MKNKQRYGIEYVRRNLAGDVGKLLSMRYGARTVCLVVSDAVLEKCVKESIASAGGAYRTCASTEEAILAQLEDVTAGGGAPLLFAIGDAKLRTIATGAIDTYASTGDEKCPFVFWQTAFVDAVSLPPTGDLIPDLTLTDPNTFAPIDTEGYRTALAKIIQLSLCFDASLFEEVYASFDEEKLLGHCRALLHELAVAAKNGKEIQPFLTFGIHGAAAANILAEGTLTEGEALSIGMLIELAIGVRAGLSRIDMVKDVDGALTYFGFPRGIDCTKKELATAFCNTFDSAEEVILHLPHKAGQCRVFKTDCTALRELITSMK